MCEIFLRLATPSFSFFLDTIYTSHFFFSLQFAGPSLDDVCHIPDSVAEASSSLVNKINYSDLASILMDGGFDTCKVCIYIYTLMSIL